MSADTSRELTRAVRTADRAAVIADSLPERTFGVRGDGNPSNYVSETNYSPYGEPLRISLAAADSTANVSIGYQYYEPTRRLKQMNSHRETSTGYMPVTDLTYSYDQIGNITQITDAPSGTKTDTQCFTHDYLRRLTQVWTPGNHNCTTTPTTTAMGGAAPYWLNWTFDKTGNRLTETNHTTGGDTVRTHTYPVAGQPRPHAVQTVTTNGPAGTRADQYGYDATGNTTSRGVTGAASTLDYDLEGRLAEATDPDAGTSTYLYDADGNRLLKREPDATIVYLPGMELRRDATTGTVIAIRYYTHNGTTIAVRTSGGVTWTLPDHQGTVAATVNSDASTVSRRFRDPYGNLRGRQPATWPDRRGYLNAPTDATGLTHLGAREFDSATGRFLSVDPVLDTTDPQQFNGYAYGRNNPVTFADPSGLWIPIGNSGPWVDSGACRDGDCWNRPHGQPGRGGGGGYGGPRSEAEQADDILGQPALGQKPDRDILDTLRSRGYYGSDNFTVLDALEFASLNDQAWGIVCQNVFDVSPDGCKYNPFTDATDNTEEVVDAIGGFFVDIAEFASCRAGGVGVAACFGIKAARGSAASRGDTSGRTMYHYTDEKGQRGVLESGKLNPSRIEANPNDAKHGDGQYLTDIAPGSKTCSQLSRCFLGNPFQGRRFTHYVEINVRGLTVTYGRNHVYVVLNQKPLDISGRIVRWGVN